ncbi:unannotated protein [freshwater metagenome]|uniref:Unannotated protein n=1 Tax=freshwater metagenome TaxID=449393 RepID=A0A6J6Z0G4_9ZZZZ
MVGDHPVDAGNHDRVGALTRAVTDLHRDDRHFLGHAVRGATQRAGDMGAVTVAIRGEGAVAEIMVRGARHAAGELGVCHPQTGVDHIRGDPRAGGRIGVARVERQRPLVEAIEAPRRGTRLTRRGGEDVVGFDGDDTGCGAQALGPLRIHLHGRHVDSRRRDVVSDDTLHGERSSAVQQARRRLVLHEIPASGIGDCRRTERD